MFGLYHHPNKIRGSTCYKIVLKFYLSAIKSGQVSTGYKQVCISLEFSFISEKLRKLTFILPSVLSPYLQVGKIRDFTDMSWFFRLRLLAKAAAFANSNECCWRFEPSSRNFLTGEQPDPWDLLQPQDKLSRPQNSIITNSADYTFI